MKYIVTVTFNDTLHSEEHTDLVNDLAVRCDGEQLDEVVDHGTVTLDYEFDNQEDADTFEIELEEYDQVIPRLDFTSESVNG